MNSWFSGCPMIQIWIRPTRAEQCRNNMGVDIKHTQNWADEHSDKHKINLCSFWECWSSPISGPTYGLTDLFPSEMLEDLTCEGLSEPADNHDSSRTTGSRWIFRLRLVCLGMMGPGRRSQVAHVAKPPWLGLDHIGSHEWFKYI